MRQLEVWWSPVAQCWRVEDGEMFTYYSIDMVVGHFTNRYPTAGAIMAGVHDTRYRTLVAALQAAGVVVEFTPEEA